MKPLYTMVFRQAGQLWVGICLENGLVGQGATRPIAKQKLQEAIDSFVLATADDADVHQMPIRIDEFHEFLTLDVTSPDAELYELQAVYA